MGPKARPEANFHPNDLPSLNHIYWSENHIIIYIQLLNSSSIRTVYPYPSIYIWKSKQIEISPPTNILVDAGDQGALWHGSNHSVLLLTVLEYHHGGDAPDAQLGRDVGVLVSV